MYERFYLRVARVAGKAFGSLRFRRLSARSSITACFRRRYLRVTTPDSRRILVRVSFTASVLLALAGGYFFGSEWTTEALRAQWQAEIIRQQSKLAEDAASWNVQLGMLAGKVAMFEARLVRLDVLGTRLVDLYGLDHEEFDFYDDPGIGGGSYNPVGNGADGLDVAFLAEGLNSRIQMRELQLSILKDVIGKGELIKEMMPSGWPVAKGWVSSKFGNRISPFKGRLEFHPGIDIASREGTPVYALAGGVVVRVDEQRTDYGNMIEIDHGNGYSTRYAHNHVHLVSPGQTVRQGDAIALVGNTGRSTGAHLHVEVLKGGRQINPEKFLLLR